MPDVAPLATELRYVLNRMSRRLRREFHDDDITVSNLSVLAVLLRDGSMTVGDLAATERVRPSSMSRIIRNLEQMRLIERCLNPADGRQVLVALTPFGRARVIEESAARERWLAKQLAALSPEERTLLQRATDILNQLADQ